MNHRWEQADEQPNPDVFRHYICKRCGAGPIRIEVMASKSGIVRLAKKAGIEPNCKHQQTKDVLES